MSSPDDIAAALGGLAKHDELSTVKHYLDTGYPPLNHALSSRWDGGMASGRIIEIYGPESAGKTAIATMAMISAQKAGGYAAFADHERSFAQHLAVGMGLDPHPGRFLYRKPNTFEESLALCIEVAMVIREKKLIKPEAPICWVFDSLPFMIPNSVFYDPKTGKPKPLGQRSMHDNTALARATSANMPAFAQLVDDLNICAIFLNQIRLNIGVVYGNPETTPGGKTPRYVYSTRISLGIQKIAKGEGKDAEITGSKITARTTKNKVSRPFQAASFILDYTEDGKARFNFHRSMIEFLKGEKLLKTAGAYVEWEGKKYFSGQLADKLMAEPDGYDKLKALLPAEYQAPIISDDEVADITGEAAAPDIASVLAKAEERAAKSKGLDEAA
jgi:recombination protein RecA